MTRFRREGLSGGPCLLGFVHQNERFAREGEGPRLTTIGHGSAQMVGGEGLRSRIKKLAKKHNCAVIVDMSKGILGDNNLMLDQNHPNSDGHKIIAERLAKVMRREIPSLFK